MDKVVTEFFNLHKDTEHNKDILPVPDHFLNAKTDEEFFNFFKWIRHSSQAKSLKLDIETDISEMRQELKSLEFLGIPHRGHPGWRSITLYGYSSIMPNSYEQ